MNVSTHLIVKTEKNPAYRYDIFKGSVGSNGKIDKIRSVGSAYHREGQKTLSVNLKTFLEDRFYLLPDTKPESTIDYVILTREIAKNVGKKYFWNSIGEGRIMEGINHGLMKLSWDVLADDLYMCLHPIKGHEAIETESAA